MALDACLRLARGPHADAATRETAMAAFAKSWRREQGMSAFGVTRKWTSGLTQSQSVAKTDPAIEAWYHRSIA
jgi:hypothetical protein